MSLFSAGLFFFLLNQASAEPAEILAPLYIEYEYQGEVFVLIEESAMAEAAKPVAPAKLHSPIQKYTVLPGDTLQSISFKLYGTNHRWKHLYEANADVAPDPMNLKPGIELFYIADEAPAPPAERKLSSGMIDADKLIELLDKWINPDRITLLRASAKDQDGKRRISFEDVRKAGIQIEFRMERVETHLFVPPELRKPRVHILRDMGLKVSQEELTGFAPFSSYMNIYASQTYEVADPATGDGFEPFAASFNGAFNYKSYVTEWNALYRDERSEDQGSNWVRQDVRVIKDFPDSYTRATAGDLNYSTSYFQQFRSMGGFSLASEFRLQPYKLVVPSGNRTIFLKSASVVTVIRNGERLQSISLPAGSHSIRELPVSPGINNITLEIRDSSGRIEYVEVPVATTSQSLAQGIHQYSYNLGVRSETVGSDIRYDEEDPVFSAFHRYGFTDHLTLGMSVQADEKQGVGGGEALLATAIGSFQMDGAYSQIDGSYKDWAARLLYSYEDHRKSNKAYRSVVASAEWTGKRFAFLDDLTPERVPEWIYLFSYSQQLTESITANFIANYQVSRRLDEPYTDAHNFEAGVSKNFGTGIYSSLSFSQGSTSTGHDETTFHVFMSYSIPEHRQTFSVTSDTDNTEAGKRRDLRGEWRYNRGGRSNRLELLAAAEDRIDSHGGDLQAGYVGNRGQVGVAHDIERQDRMKTRHSTRAYANTGLAFAGGHFTWGQPVTDSFAIVTRPKHWKGQSFDINPGPDNTFDARVNGFGPALVPSLNSYQYSQIYMDNTQLEEGLQFENTNFVLLPGYKSGFLIEPGTDASVMITGSLIDAQQKPVGLITGQVTGIALKEPVEYFTNAEGGFAIEGLKPGKYILKPFDRNWENIEFEIPAGTTGRFDIGVLKAVAR